MGVRIQVASCGRCGKPRGLTHTCLSQRNRPTTVQIRPTITGTCPTCGQPRLNPLTHTCVIRTDFTKRKAAWQRKQAADRKRQATRARRQAAAARKRERDAERRRKARAARQAAADRKRKRDAERRRKARGVAAERRKAATALRTGAAVPAARLRRGSQHDYRACADARCERFACLVWKEAFRDGQDAGYEAGYVNGHREGLAVRAGAGEHP